MIFTPKHILEVRHTLLEGLEEGGVPTDELCHKLLSLDPADHTALIWLGLLRLEAGDSAGAETLFWQSLQIQPCSTLAYTALSRVIRMQPERTALADALLELGHLKLRRENDEDTAPLLAEAKATRRNEPPEVTRQLHLLRLLDDILGQEDLSTSDVDTILNEGPPMIPLLVSVLRAWVDNLLGDHDWVLENALALLGELGTAEEIRHLLEFVDLDHQVAAGAARWAMLRIVERQPLQARQLFRSLAPDLGLTGRLTVVDQIVHHRALDPDCTLLASLAENLDTIKSPERDQFFPLLLSGMVAAQGTKGVRLAREALRRQRTQLSPGVRRDCEEMLKYLGMDELEPIEPGAPEWTVYDICQGRADWALEEDPGEESDDEFSLPPEPLRRLAAPGRNDPCWCNSGKKYKKCHLDSDQRGQTSPSASAQPGGENEFSGLRDRIGNFLVRSLTTHERKRAVEEFIQDLSPFEEPDRVVVIDWILHDWILPRLGHTLMADFLQVHQDSLSPREREMVGAWAESFISLYEVEAVEPGVGLRLRDVLLGGSVFVHERAISGRVAPTDHLFARVLPGERGTELGGAGQLVPPGKIAALLQWMEEDRRVGNGKLDWRSYLKGNWNRIRREVCEFFME